MLPGSRLVCFVKRDIEVCRRTEKVGLSRRKTDSGRRIPSRVRNTNIQARLFLIYALKSKLFNAGASAEKRGFLPMITDFCGNQ
jgi:hypothetical protein